MRLPQVFEYLHEIDNVKLVIAKRNMRKLFNLANVESTLSARLNDIACNFSARNRNAPMMKIAQIACMAAPVIKYPIPWSHSHKITRIDIPCKAMKNSSEPWPARTYLE